MSVEEFVNTGSSDVTESVNEDTQDSELETEETEESEESEETEETEESEDKAPKKLTAEERKEQLQKEIQELANQRRALKETLEQEVVQKIQEELQKQKEEVPPYIEVDWERLDAHIAAEVAEIDSLKAEGRASEAMIKQRQLNKLYDSIEENEKLKNEWVSKKEQESRMKQDNEQINKAIVQAADIVRKSLSITEDDWKLGEQWFLEKRRSDPMIDVQYREKVMTQGPAHALKWAADYVRDNMGADAKAAKEKREEGKKKSVGGSSAGDSSSKTPKSFDELMKLSDKELVRLEKTSPKLFNKLINQKLK